MEFTLERKKAFTVIGIPTQIAPEEGYVKCPKFWEEEYNEKYHHLWLTMKPQNEEEKAIVDNMIGMYAVCTDRLNGFEYMIAGEYQGGFVPPNMKLIDFPETDWAIFKTKGPLPESLQALNTKVWHEWYPGEGQAFFLNGTETIERYSMGDQTAEDYECEIWLPVVRKPKKKKLVDCGR